MANAKHANDPTIKCFDPIWMAGTRLLFRLRLVMQDIYIVLNHTCNLACPTCIRKNVPSCHEIMTNEKGQYILNSIVKSFPSAGIVLTGGEPFLNPDWETICQEALRLFNKVCICSNGVITEENINKLQPLLNDNVFIQISIDGDENGDAQIRGYGHYNQALKTLLKLQPNFRNVIISTTVNRKNIITIPVLVDTLNDFQFLYWKLSWMQSDDPTKDLDEIPYQEWNGFVDTIINRCHFRVHTSHQFDTSLWDDALKTRRYRNKKIISNCGFGSQKLYIFPNGDVRPCSCIPILYGNLFREDIQQIILKIKPIDIPTDSICFMCKYKELCKSGCPGYSYKVYGKFGYGDIRCPKVKANYDSKH